VNYNDAQRAVRDIKGVESLVNNIEVLPLGLFDNQIRASALAVLQGQLSMYFWGAGSDIKIIVKNGNVILLGYVIRQADADIAFIKVNGLPSVFHVFNMLEVKPGV
jgi:osmotically-inducible protein OsmY